MNYHQVKTLNGLMLLVINVVNGIQLRACVRSQMLEFNVFLLLTGIYHSEDLRTRRYFKYHLNDLIGFICSWITIAILTLPNTTKIKRKKTIKKTEICLSLNNLLHFMMDIIIHSNLSIYLQQWGDWKGLL